MRGIYLIATPDITTAYTRNWQNENGGLHTKRSGAAEPLVFTKGYNGYSPFLGLEICQKGRREAQFLCYIDRLVRDRRRSQDCLTFAKPKSAANSHFFYYCGPSNASPYEWTCGIKRNLPFMLPMSILSLTHFLHYSNHSCISHPERYAQTHAPNIHLPQESPR